MNGKAQTHYQLLGIDMSADPDTVREALARLAQQADALAYTSPQQSHELWARIRQMREELLSGSEHRYAYDRSVLAIPAQPAESARHLSPPRVIQPLEQESDPLARGVLIAIPVALVGLAAGAALLVHNQPTHHAPSASPAHGVALGGPRDGSAAASGTTIHLTWNPVPGATLYRLEYATSPSGAPTGLRWHTVTTTRLSSDLTVVGPQVYFWRVQARGASGWRRYALASQFVVKPPQVAAPTPLLPADHGTVPGQQVRFCWSPVPGAVDYHFRIRGLGVANVTGTCVVRNLTPGTYRWTVAARVRGTRLFLGPYTPRQYFTVRVPEVAARTPHHRSHGVAGPGLAAPAARVSASRPATRQGPSSARPASAVGAQRSVSPSASGSPSRVAAVVPVPTHSTLPSTHPTAVPIQRPAPPSQQPTSVPPPPVQHPTAPAQHPVAPAQRPATPAPVRQPQPAAPAPARASTLPTAATRTYAPAGNPTPPVAVYSGGSRTGAAPPAVYAPAPVIGAPPVQSVVPPGRTAVGVPGTVQVPPGLRHRCRRRGC